MVCYNYLSVLRHYTRENMSICLLGQSSERGWQLRLDVGCGTSSLPVALWNQGQRRQWQTLTKPTPEAHFMEVLCGLLFQQVCLDPHLSKHSHDNKELVG